MTFEGKSVLVTGGASGLGLAISEAFIEEGAFVSVVDVSGQEDKVADSLGERAMAIHGDVSDALQAEAAISATMDRFGRLDVLCNNAGIDGPTALTGDADVDAFDRVLAVNLRAPFLMSKYAIPAMLASGGGSIVNIASGAGLVGIAGQPAYCASKGGLANFTRAVALEYARQGIRANCVCPGAIETSMFLDVLQSNPEFLEPLIAAHPMGRIAKPAEIAAAVVYLASDKAGFVTGVNFPVDGGYVAG